MSVLDSSAKKIIDLLGITTLGYKGVAESLSVVPSSELTTFPGLPASLGSKIATESFAVVLSTDTGLCTNINALVSVLTSDTETVINLADYASAPHRAIRVRCRDSADYPAAEIRMAFQTGKVAAALYPGAIVIPVGSEWTLPWGVFNKAHNTLYLASVVVPVFVEIELWTSPTGV